MHSSQGGIVGVTEHLEDYHYCMDNPYVRMVYPFIMTILKHLFPKARGEIIRLLFTDPEVSLHLRDLARQSGLALGTIQGEVANLKEAELLLEKRDGNRLYFRANQSNPLFTELQAIARKTCGVQNEISQTLTPLAGIEFAFIYGSFARHEASSESDIDLFVIGSIGLRGLASPLRNLSQSLNREVNASTYSKSSYIEKLNEGDAFIQSVQNSPKLWIIGTEDEFGDLA
ncbi:MAG: nucleotidyltransferase domain-containing protein [Puniceicoccaceae bacterium]